jgi:hypothetical protein
MIPAAEAVGAAINAGKPIATHAEGWSRTAIGVWALFAALVPILATGMFKLIPVMRKLANEREKTIDDERRADMVDMRKEITDLKAELAAMRVSHEAEIGIMRHRANNATMCIDALLMLLKAAPEKVAEHIETITTMRDRQRLEEAAEKGAVSAAKITAATPATPAPATT